MSTGHQPGLFKRPAKAHKTFKGKRSKGQIDAGNRGRVGMSSVIRARKRLLSKEERHQQAVHIRANKRRAAFEQRRGLDGGVSAPTLITVIAFGGSQAPAEFVAQIAECDETIVRTLGHNVDYLGIPRFKSRVGFISADLSKLDYVLDSVKVSDVVCFLWPLQNQLSDVEHLLLTVLKAHGLPSFVNVAPHLGSVPVGKKKEDARKNVQSLIAEVSLTTSKLFCCDTEAERVLLLRHFVDMKKNKMLLQKRRPHILVEKLDVVDDNDGICSILATGYLRGPTWNVNHLVHIQGWGDFQIGRILAHVDPHPMKQVRILSKENLGGDAVVDPKVLVVADESRRESLQSEIVPDPLDAEQTWPDEYDVKEDAQLKKVSEKRNVPKGTSSYQAAWIVDGDEDSVDGSEEDSEEDEDEEENEAGMEMEATDENDTGDQENNEDMEDLVSESADDGGDEADDLDEVSFPSLKLRKHRHSSDNEISYFAQITGSCSSRFKKMKHQFTVVEKYRRERENAQFPDEVDTPIGDLARIRFQKYRGLKSFRTSPWDPKENLPSDYARIFQFQNYKKTRKNVLSTIGEYDSTSCVFSGQYVTLQIDRVPVTFAQQWDVNAPMVLYQLLPHEQRMSVLNFVIRKHPSCRVPIMNKQKLIFNVGFRKFEACPIFSQHTNGDKFKLERFLPTNASCVATVFAPIIFPPASVLVFREGKSGKEELVATGSILDINPDRIVLKRIVLSGHPFKINKRSVVCRYMFFNREDIEWFKPVELYTPSGRRGHIKEPLGTHGHMKCRFDQQLNAGDSVMMSLYKRIFPKWTYNPRVRQVAQQN
ncbi:AARP2CN domain protein [Ancylostoma caninum]|uniref:Pre-rRNA-processing protein TSR1 homolog n=1 Tax=Ancylostoma caninum TaxID=29170 RepID=A0A368G1Y4_ANCCA|nr:AARP2CN domain protein [Ancylostoma caninum]